MPESGYSVTAKNFSLGETISGFAGEDNSSLPFVPPKNYTYKAMYYYYMFSDAQLIVADDFSADGAGAKFNEFSAAVNATLRDINSALSANTKDSDIYKFNNYVAGVEFEISKITYEVLSEALAVYELTEGYYNPALYYNISAYGFDGSYDFPEKESELPDEELLAVYSEIASHFKDITLRENNGKYYVKKPEYSTVVNDDLLTLKLDLGGIGKGYAVDKIDELYEEYGYEYGLFNFGASSMLIKSHAAEGNYNVEFVSPRSNRRDGYIKIPARNEKLSTSGDNEQYYFIDGVRYCHIIDPTTGKPVQSGIMSATIIGGGAAEDDALTTAIMCMGKDKAIKFIEEKLTDRRVVFTVDDK